MHGKIKTTLVILVVIIAAIISLTPSFTKFIFDFSASKVLGDILAKTAIKGAVVYGAAAVAGVSLAGRMAIPVGAGMVLTEEAINVS